jgi:hypothetical protein
VRLMVDSEGARWDVIVGRESWGSFFAIFVPRRGAARPRQTLLQAESNEAATRELEALDDEDLIRLFNASQPKDIGES